MHNNNLPLLSVVVPVYNSVLYLEECLDSLLDQGFTDQELEVLMVNDGSIDGSDLILKKYSEKHPNFHLINRDNGGLSAARNTGLSKATGRYITFCDSDDVVPTGSYRKSVDILIKSGSDFLVGPIYRFSQENPALRPFNRVKDLFVNEKLRVSIDTNPEYIRETTPHNKIYSRKFFLSTGVMFPEGRIYEDVSTTPVLYMSSKTFDVVDYPVYYWRVTPGGITQTIKPIKATDRLWAINQVLKYFKDNKIARHITDEYDFGIIDYNLRWVFLDLWKFDKETRHKVVSSCYEILRNIDDEIIARVQHPISSWAFQIKRGNADKVLSILSKPHNVVDRPANLSFIASMLSSLKRYSSAANRRLRHIVGVLLRRTAKSFVYLVFRPIIYTLPIKNNLSVFSSYWGKEFLPYGPAVICMKLNELAPGHTKIVFASKSRYDYVINSITKSASYTDNIKVVKNDTLGYYYYLWRAKYLFNDVNFSVGYREANYVQKRPGQIEVQTTHGIPLKTLGLDSKDYENDFDRKIFLAKSQRYDYLASPSPEVAKTFASSHGVNPKILKTGLPQNDFLFQDYSSEDIRRIKNKYGLNIDKKIIVYTPTFRYGNGYSFRYLIDFDQLYKKFGDGYQLVVKVHPFNHTHLQKINFLKYTTYTTNPSSASEFIILLGEIRSDEGYSPIRQTSSSMKTQTKSIIPGDINELMLVADALVTDYSSIIFSYTHLDKPLILFTPDKEFYNKNRGIYYDIDNIAPGAVTKSTGELIEAIEAAGNKSVWSDLYGKRITKFKKKFLTWEKGDAADKIINQIGLIDTDDNLRKVGQ